MLTILSSLACLVSPSKSVGSSFAKTNTPLLIVAELSDGSRLTGVLPEETVRLRTAFATLDLPLRRITTIEFKDTAGNARISLENGDSLQGTVQFQTLVIKTSFGLIAVPVSEMRQLLVRLEGQGSGKRIVLKLDGRQNCVIIDPQGVKSPQLPPGKYRLTLAGEGLKQGQSPESILIHYAYIFAYGHNPPYVDVVTALYGNGHSKVIDLSRGGIIGAFLQDSFAGDNSGFVTVRIDSLQNNQSHTLTVDNRQNVVIVTPARAESPDLPPGKYRITLGGEGVRHGRGPQDNLLHYAYIIAFGPRTEVAAALEGKGATTTIDLPRGGVIGAFLGDSYSGDNSGSVEVEIEAMR